MFEAFLTPGTMPFAVAIGLMFVIALTEATGTLFGMSPSGLIDQLLPDVDVDADVDVDVDANLNLDAGAIDGEVAGAGEPQGFLSQLLGWLCIGKVPVLVLLVAFLTTFGLMGFFIQGVAASIVGFHLPTILASIAALVLALPPTRWLALGLSRIMPKEETEVVSTRSFIGRIATVTRGVARVGEPAEAKLRDRHGHTHYVLVEPDDAGAIFESGTEVLLTAQSSAARFVGIANNHALLSKTQ